MTSEANGGAIEPEQPKGDLFSSMKNQMSSWLSKKETKETTEEQLEETKEQEAEASAAEVVAENRTEDTGEIEGDKEGFGSGNVRSIGVIVMPILINPFQFTCDSGLEEVSNKAMQGARTIGSFFVSAVSKAGKTVTEAGKAVTEAGAKIKKTVEETVS